MGKTQSKRSVDITTEGKKGPEEEVTGKLEKIEDIDQKQVNGDATPQENKDAEKKDADESENDKDLTTEKSAEAAQASGDNNGDQNNATTATKSADSPKEDSAAAADATVAGKDGAAAAAEEISPLADESIKKSKKEKVKKKWSFRSISFGKKDKQKPAKTEEAAENVAAAAAAATNGEAEKPAAEGVTEETKKDEAAAAGDAAAAAADVSAPAEKLENGDATEKELNGQKTPSPIEEKKSINETVTNETNATTLTTSSPTPSPTATSPAATIKETAAVTIAAMEIKLTENQTAVVTAVEETTVNVVTAVAAAADAIVSNGDGASADAGNADKNSIEASAAATAAADAVVENIKTIPSCVVANDDEKPHQNGTNGDNDAEAIVATAAEQIKSSQLEVNTNDNNNTVNNTPPTPPSPQAPAENLLASSQSEIETTTTTNPNPIPNSSSNPNSDEPRVVQEFKVVDDDNSKPLAATVAVAENERTVVVVDVANAGADVAAAAVDEKSLAVDNAAAAAVTSVSNGNDSDNNDRKSDVSAQCDTTQPPPLPVSPPPSQVSVFAFNDNSESVEAVVTVGAGADAGVGDNCAANVETAGAGGDATVVAIAAAVQNEKATPEKGVPPANEEDNKQNAEQNVVAVAVPETVEAAAIASVADAEHTHAPNVGVPQKNANEIEYQTAATIVDEITEKAVEIIKQQQQQEESQVEIIPAEIETPQVAVVDQAPQQNGEPAETEALEKSRRLPLEPATQAEKSIEEDACVATTNADEELQHTSPTPPPTPAAALATSHETADNNAHELPTANNANGTEQTENQIEKNHIAAEAEAEEDEDCQLITQEIVKLSLNNITADNNCKSINDVHDVVVVVKDAAVDVHSDDVAAHTSPDTVLSSTKEIANAKDLKDAAAAAEITTQDLPVTCE